MNRTSCALPQRFVQFCREHGRATTVNRLSVEVVFIHPGGNFWNNPQLSAIIEILLEQGKSVAVVAQEGPFLQAPFSSKMEVVLLPKLVTRLLLRLHVAPWGWLLFRTSRLARGLARRSEQVVAIDADGIALASRFFNNGRELGFISYELFFEEEIGASLKRTERQALLNCSWFAAADSVRADELAAENRLPRERVITAPVAHRMQDIDRALEARARVETRERRVLHVGSTETWTRLDEVTETVSTWPDDWQLVIHDRYGRPQYHDMTVASRRIEFSDETYERNSDLIELVSRADVGLALYAETRGPYAGRNIRHVGLSSGKALTYLRFGTAVLTTDRGPLGQLLEREEVGWVVSSVSEIPAVLRQWSWSTEDARRAITVYNNELATGRKSCELTATLLRGSHGREPAVRTEPGE